MRPLVVGARVAETCTQQEAVELGFGKRVGAFVLDRVLRCEHQERALERPCHAVCRHLALLHGLEQRRLRLRRRPVDLVREEQVGEHGTGSKFEVDISLVPDRRARDVGGHEVGSELDAGEPHLRYLGEGARCKCFRETWVVLEQDVTVAEQAEQHEFERLALAHDCALDLVEDLPAQIRELSRAASEAFQRGDDAVEGRDVDTGRVPVLGRRVIRPHQLPRVGAERGCGSYRLTLEIDTTARREQASGGLAEGGAQPSVEIPRVLPAERDLALEPLELFHPLYRYVLLRETRFERRRFRLERSTERQGKAGERDTTTTTRYTCVINAACPGVSTIAPMRTSVGNPSAWSETTSSRFTPDARWSAL